MTYQLEDEQMWAGGTMAAKGRNNYSRMVYANDEPHGSGMYTIDAVADTRGRHRGYKVMHADGGKLIAAGVQRGLWETLLELGTLPEARRAVEAHFRQHYS